MVPFWMASVCGRTSTSTWASALNLPLLLAVGSLTLYAFLVDGTSSTAWRFLARHRVQRVLPCPTNIPLHALLLRCTVILWTWIVPHSPWQMYGASLAGRQHGNLTRHPDSGLMCNRQHLRALLHHHHLWLRPRTSLIAYGSSYSQQLPLPLTLLSWRELELELLQRTLAQLPRPLPHLWTGVRDVLAPVG